MNTMKEPEAMEFSLRAYLKSLALILQTFAWVRF